ncbi:8-oxo-dGTP diphosphatase [Oribacterium sp. oral taxon 102]|uniref:8-oxo-dGTP diphosphatase n=1 Tax=Oribacterium sp. oral taxon 102 TaxID=671214 RepID=UPI0015BC2CF4|nr:8-oxo-dGTP diphosphatase [Oribacterium sp. oral taxon 102]NWO20646.1 8-oxo-dGTP diphosphatase [Oribacterium sp. oral taxon 102]
MRKTETVELTVLCLIEDGNRILLQNRVKKDWQGYALPGGHVEPGESFVDAVIREMKEETGLTVIEPRLAGVKQFPIENGRYVVLLFKATRWFGDLISSDEGQMEWIEYDSIPSIRTVDDFDELLRVINSPELTEFQYLVSGDEWKVSIR